MPAPKPSPEDVALSLTLAVVTFSPVPLLLLDGQLTVIAASHSFCDAFELSPSTLIGRPLYALDEGEWDNAQLRSLMDETLSGARSSDGEEIVLQQRRQAPRHLIIQTRRLVYLDLEQTRVLVAVSDVTGADDDVALREDALRENGILLQEVRHRVANSLQIIASVLLQNARKSESDETRGHLENAHSRVMSVAALERMLSTSPDGDIEVQAYFTSLCETITASMIGDTDQVALVVEGGEAIVEARVSVSLGLIVTELVINALKYAFPDGRPGRIVVDYNFNGPNWVLCVSDNGVGMPLIAPVRVGLGKSIVDALARQLNAVVEVVPERPCTKVSIHHTRIALVADEPVEADAGLTTPVASASGRQTKERS